MRPEYTVEVLFFAFLIHHAPFFPKVTSLQANTLPDPSFSIKECHVPGPGNRFRSGIRIGIGNLEKIHYLRFLEQRLKDSVMKKKVFLIAFAAAALIVAGCRSNTKKENAGKPACCTEAVPTEKCASCFYGTYEGTLPAADCEGIRTTLVLNEDTTYDLTTVYLDGKEEEIKTSGVYERSGEDLIILITPSTGFKTYYKIVENGVALTDAEGKSAEGELAEFYILKRK